MRKAVFASVAAAVILAFAPTALANGLNLNGLGARAISLGGAFVALADDFTSVFWNPAGLARIAKGTFGASGSDIIPSGSYTLTLPQPVGTVIDTTTQTKHYLGGIAAYAAPIAPGLVAALGIYTPSGLGASWDGSKMGYISGGRTDIEWMSKVGLVTFAPSIAYSFSDAFAIGASLNINYGMFDTSMYAGSVDLRPMGLPFAAFDLGQYKESETGWGVGATIGLQVRPSSAVSFGAVLRTASTVKFSGSASIDKLPALGVNGSSDMRRSVTWPMWLAAGVAVHPFDALTLSADVQWTQWSKIQTIATTYLDASWAPLMASSGKDVMPMYWQDALQVRFGAEYALSQSLKLRAGYYMDPSAAPDRTMNILLPNYDFKGITFGLGYAAGPVAIDAGCEILLGTDRTISPDLVNTDPNYAHAVPGLYKMTIFAPSISFAYRFD